MTSLQYIPSSYGKIYQEIRQSIGERSKLMRGVQTQMTEKVNHPQHYQSDKIEVIDIIEAFDLNFHLGNVVKYVLRSNSKGNYIEDLQKAKWYLERELERHG